MVFESILAIFMQYGLVGIFLSSFASSLIFFFGIVDALIPIYISIGFDPVSVFILVSIGSVLGGLINYLIGISSSKILVSQQKRAMKLAKGWLNRWGNFSIFITAFVPGFPFDFVAVFVGFIKMDFKLFFISMVLGKLIKYALIIGIVTYGVEAFLTLFPYG